MFVKICGITNEDDALLATALDADALGFVFAPSPRQVDAETVRDIVRRLPREVHTVGVFRDERPERIVEIVGRAGLHGVQLHGDEPASEVDVDPRARAVRDPGVRRGRSRARRRAATSAADIILVDSPDPGSGKVFDWRLAEGAPRGQADPARGRPHARERRRRDPARPAVGRRRVERRRAVARVARTRRKLRRFVVAAREPRPRSTIWSSSPATRAIDLTVDEVAGVTRPWDWQIDE